MNYGLEGSCTKRGVVLGIMFLIGNSWALFARWKVSRKMWGVVLEGLSNSYSRVKVV